jgi:hypothetical protein
MISRSEKNANHKITNRDLTPRPLPALEKMLFQAESAQGRVDRKTRQHLMQRSFARGTRYGIKQARWRRLWRVEIPEYLTAAIQNMVVLIRYLKEPLRALSAALSPAVDRGSSKKLNRWEILAPRAIATLARHIPALRGILFSRKFSSLRAELPHWALASGDDKRLPVSAFPLRYVLGRMLQRLQDPGIQA